MNNTSTAIEALFNNIPRRHTSENVKEIYSLLDEYENLLITIEAINPYYEKNIPPYFEELEAAKVLIKKSNDNKASKKLKDTLFDEASGIIKDSISNLKLLYGDGNKTN